MSKDKFGKTFAGYKKIRESFFDKGFNDSIVERLVEADRMYREQPKRTGCKLCGTEFGVAKFQRNNIDYFICKNCGHLNGGHQDTEEYNHALYSDETSDHATNRSYSDKDIEKYNFRVENIYQPKAVWLKESLTEVGETADELNVVDIGAGAGHMVKALRLTGFKGATGYDVYRPNLDLGNKFIGEEVLFHHELNCLESLTESVEADVITTVFVLEHVSDPRGWCKALKRNPSVKYALISVPMFGPTAVMEMVFPHVMHRVLGLGHTHLFTRKSVNWLFQHCGLEIIANWWFGADAFDFHRNIHMHLRHQLKSPELSELWDEMVEDSLDEIQLALDHVRSSSEIHAIVRIR
jgi:hypothetical protein